MSNRKSFPTLGVLSVTTGTLLTQIGDVYEVCGHVLGDPGVMTHQLPAASEAATPEIFAQLPQLADVQISPADHSDTEWRTKFAATCAEIVDRFGETLELAPAENPQWRPGRARQDLAEMLAGTGKPVVVVDLGDPS